MEAFTFVNPVKVVFGVGTVEQAGVEARAIGRRALLVSGKGHAARSGLLDRVAALLQGAGVAVTHLTGVDPNPRLTSVEQGIALCKENDLDLVVGLGGGSCMDCAKLVAAGVRYAGDPWDMILHGQQPHVPPTDSLPTVMIPTLAATGSEMNSSAVLTNDATRCKSYVSGQTCMCPRVCVADPQLTCSVPPDQTACGAVDILAHVLEPYVNGVDDTPLQDRMQEGVMLTVMENAPRAVAAPDDLTARTHLQWSSIVALNGWASRGCGASFCMHHIEHAVTARTGLAHGAGLAIIMPAFMKLACALRTDKYVQLAERVFGINAAGRAPAAVANDGISCLEGFIRDLGVATHFSEIEISPDIFAAVADDAIRVTGGPDARLGGRPRLDRDGVRQVLELAL